MSNKQSLATRAALLGLSVPMVKQLRRIHKGRWREGYFIMRKGCSVEECDRRSLNALLRRGAVTITHYTKPQKMPWVSTTERGAAMVEWTR